jgi:hypothetical protein
MVLDNFVKLGQTKVRQNIVVNAVEMCEENLFGMYCNIDGEGRHRVLSLGQKEQLFLEALVCARGGQPRLTDAEYDALKEDLEWQGSLLATLTPEQRLLFEAAKAHEGPSAEEGQLLSDAEYDALRRRMRMDGVAFALPGFIVHGPRCSLRSRRVFTDVGQDVSRSFALNLPSLLLVLLSLATVTAASGVDVPFGWAGYIAALLIAFPIMITASRQLTSTAMDFSAVFTAQCPQCGQQLDVKLPRSGDTSFPLGCPHCQSTLSYDNPSHQVTLI